MNKPLKQGYYPLIRIRWRWLCRLWARVYANWLTEKDEVIAVVGWRTAMVKSPGRVAMVSPCFWRFQ